ncbi:MAG: arginyltransferase [Sulfurovaceae bacterium]
MNKNDALNPPSTDFSMLDYECAYLPDKLVRMNYKYVTEPNIAFASAVIQRGWRRFGKYYFHPTCNGCNECKSLRIDVKNFIPSKSQKKAIKRNTETQIIIGRPSLTKHHIELYNKYHYHKQDKDGWKYRPISQKEYYENFVDGAEDFGREVLYFQNEKLIGVDLIDILQDGISSIYCYYNPDYYDLSIGTFSLLYQIELAKQLGLRWIYLGYWVEGCKAFAYKTNFQPQELLDGFPVLENDPKWKK